MPIFEVWFGGATFNEGDYPPFLLGRVEAETFDDACKVLHDIDAREVVAGNLDQNLWRKRSDGTWTNWGSAVYPSKQEAFSNFLN